MIFVNLPVTELERSVTLYAAMGWTQNLRFSDPTAACMVWSDTIHVMLLTHAKWRGFTERDIPDAHQSAQVLLCLSVEQRQDVDRLVEIAGRSGGSADPNAIVDYPSMYSRSLSDPDGHIWEVMWMDPASALLASEAEAGSSPS